MKILKYSLIILFFPFSQGWVPDSPRAGTRADDIAGDDIPRLDQHLQQCHRQVPQRGGQRLHSHIK